MPRPAGGGRDRRRPRHRRRDGAGAGGGGARGRAGRPHPGADRAAGRRAGGARARSARRSSATSPARASVAGARPCRPPSWDRSPSWSTTPAPRARCRSPGPRSTTGTGCSAVNATGAFLCTRAFLPGHARAALGPRGQRRLDRGPERRQVPRGLLRGQARAGRAHAVAAAEVAGTRRHGERGVPRFVDTEMTAETVDRIVAKTGRTREEALAAALASAGQTRLISADEVAAAVVSLARRAATHPPNGEALVLDGRDAMSGRFAIVNPEELGAPRGWNNGMLAPAGGRMLFVAGQTARDGVGHGAGRRFRGPVRPGARQRARRGARRRAETPEDIGRFTIYVTDMAQYRASLKPLGEVYRRRMGTHYPAMALVEVSVAGGSAGGGGDRGDGGAGGEIPSRSSTPSTPRPPSRPSRSTGPSASTRSPSRSTPSCATPSARSTPSRGVRAIVITGTGPRVLHRRRRRGHHRRAVLARRGRPARVHPPHRRSHPLDPPVPAPGRRGAQRDRRRRRRGDRGGERHPDRRGERQDRVPLLPGRPHRRRHGRRVAAAAHRRAWRTRASC